MITTAGGYKAIWIMLLAAATVVIIDGAAVIFSAFIIGPAGWLKPTIGAMTAMAGGIGVAYSILRLREIAAVVLIHRHGVSVGGEPMIKLGKGAWIQATSGTMYQLLHDVAFTGDTMAVEAACKLKQEIFP